MTNKHLVALCVFSSIFIRTAVTVCVTAIFPRCYAVSTLKKSLKKKSHGSSNYERRFTLVPILYYWARGNSKRRERVSQIMCDTIKFDFSIYFLTLFEAHLSKK